jgi:hypothetical protein
MLRSFADDVDGLCDKHQRLRGSLVAGRRQHRGQQIALRAAVEARALTSLG